MPRGRPSTGAAATPASARNASLEGSTTKSGRLTRSASIKSIPSSLPGGSLGRSSSPDPLLKAPRGRPSRSSLLARGASVSSAQTPQELSSDEDYSTPGTSKFPTPAEGEPVLLTDFPKTHSSIQVHLPARSRQSDTSERALRTSRYTLNPASNRRKMVVRDSDDEDEDFSDTSPDAIVARRLQKEEYDSASAPALAQITTVGRGRRRTVNPMETPSFQSVKPPTKRGRADTNGTDSTRPPAKKAKVTQGLDLDAEIAAGAGFNSDASDDLLFDDDSLSNDDSYISSADSDFEPKADVDQSASTKVKAKIPPAPRAAKGKAPIRPPKQPRKIRSRRATETATALELDEDAVDLPSDDSLLSSLADGLDSGATSDSSLDGDSSMRRIASQRRGFGNRGGSNRIKRERERLEHHHPEILTMWDDLESRSILKAEKAEQPSNISRQLKGFQLEGLAWMIEMEKREWKGGLLGDEMGLGKTIQAVSLIMSDYPAKQPSLVLVPPVALMQWQSEIKAYTDGTLKTFVFHGTNQKVKGITVKELKKYDIIMMSYNSLESMYRKQEKGFKRKDGMHKEKSLIHSINFHRIILDEAHSIKTRTTMTAKACFGLKTDFRWCLTGTPLQNRIGEFFSLLRFLNVTPFASYLCKQCPCSTLEWSLNQDSRCTKCNHAGMQHVSVFNQELLNPIQKYGNLGPGREAFRKLRMMTDRVMLRRLKKDHTNAMELPVKEIYVDRQFFGEEENDFANSIMTNGQRKFDTYVAQGVLLNNYANIFGLIMQMRQVADHPDLLLKKNAVGGQNVLVCCICDEPAEDTVRSGCKHEFCRTCVASYCRSTDEPDCPRCHIPLNIDLEQPEIEQDEALVKKSSIINRIKMENWTSSSKIELLVHELHKLRSDNTSHKSIIFSQFTTMLQLIEWRLRRAGITTVMLDGSMTPAQRQASIEHFMTNVDVECFLVSLKAGGVALNLTEASRVFIVDPWWNPAAEWQSADRCHRIGQTRPCTITRLCIEDSVESRMVLIQEKKTNMINSTVNSDDKAMDSLTPADMQFLFRGS